MVVTFFLNSLVPGRCGSDFKSAISKHKLWVNFMSTSSVVITLRWCLWWLVSIGPGNGLLPIGSKPLPEPMLTQMYITIGITRPQWFNFDSHSCTKNPNMMPYTNIIDDIMCHYDFTSIYKGWAFYMYINGWHYLSFYGDSPTHCNDTSLINPCGDGYSQVSSKMHWRHY